MKRFNEIREELAEVLSGRINDIIDAMLPPLAYLGGLQLCCADLGLRLALLAALLMILIRLMLRQSIVAALAGFAMAGLAGAFSILSVRAANFFLPALASSGLIAALCVISLLARRPLAAWTSYFARRWPLDWYQHPQVAPAYFNVTVAWAAIFIGRFLLQYFFYVRGAIDALGISQILLGWPMIIVLLIASYLYGTWELRRLKGPSVEEFREDKPPPWKGQSRGF